MTETLPSSKHKPGGMWEMIAIAFPMVVASACDTVLIFTDRLFMAKIDPVLMNASLTGGLSTFLMMTFFVGLMGYTTALSAQYFGAGEKRRCPVVLTQALLLVLLACPIIYVCKPLVYFLFAHSGISQEQLAYQTQYFNALIYIIPFALIKTCFNSFFSGIGRTRVVMFAAVLVMVCNVFLNYVLVFGKLGFPAYGILGSAYGSIISSALGVAVLFVEYIKPYYRREFGVMKAWVWDREVMTKLLRYGYPAGLEFFLNILSFTLMVMVFQSASAMTATAASIAINWDIVSYVPLMGIEIGVTSLVGRYMGAGHSELAHRSLMSGIKFGLCYSVMVFVLFLGFPEMLVQFFRPDVTNTLFDQSVHTASVMLRLASIYVLLEVIMIAIIGALRGAGDSFWAMILTVSFHWSLLPILYVVLHVWRQPAETAWFTMILVFFFFLALVVMRYRKGEWKKIRMVSH